MMRDTEYYYNVDDGWPIEDIIVQWAADGRKVYDASQPVWYQPEELWEYRDYVREPPPALVASLRREGWREGDPAILIFSRQGEGHAVLGEGNHRLAAAVELGIPVPVRFEFWQQAKKPLEMRLADPPLIDLNVAASVPAEELESYKRTGRVPPGTKLVHDAYMSRDRLVLDRLLERRRRPPKRSYEPRDPAEKERLEELLELLGAGRGAKKNPEDAAVRAVAVEHLQQSATLDDALASLQQHRLYTLCTPYGSVETADVIDELESYRPRPLPPGPRVLVHHSTDAETAERLLHDGFIPEAKPMNLARARYEAGEYAEFAPGRGVSGGLYVGLPGATSGYGQVTLEVSVPRDWLQVPPEQEALGVTDPMQALRSNDGAVVLAPIPAEAFSHGVRENPKLRLAVRGEPGEEPHFEETTGTRPRGVPDWLMVAPPPRASRTSTGRVPPGEWQVIHVPTGLSAIRGLTKADASLAARVIGRDLPFLSEVTAAITEVGQEPYASALRLVQKMGGLLRRKKDYLRQEVVQELIELAYYDLLYPHELQSLSPETQVAIDVGLMELPPREEHG
jgi:hypothetical protein